MWSALLQETFESDSREMDFTFSLPYFGEYGFMSLPTTFWIKMSLLLSIGSICNSLMGVLIYFHIVRKRHTPMAFIVAFGIVVPLSLLVPYYLVQLLDIRNSAMIFSLLATGPLTPFHCFEALSGTCPQFAEKDVWHFLAYHTSVVEFNVDARTGQLAKAGQREKREKLYLMLYSTIEIMLLFSILTAYSYYPFPRREIQTVLDLFYWGNLCNNYILAYATGLFLEAGTLNFGLMISYVTGYSTLIVNDSPLTSCSSPSDFWGERWNKQIHGMLKRAVYVPVRKQGYSREVAVFTTFLSSGILHEYILSILALRSVHSGTPYAPRFGSHVAFFAWNGVVLCLEYLVSGRKGITWMSQNLPRRVRTAFVLLTVLPISHLFTDEYVLNGMLPDFAMAFPRIVKLSWNCAHLGP